MSGEKVIEKRNEEEGKSKIDLLKLPLAIEIELVIVLESSHQKKSDLLQDC
jgi:hypothetical protein